MHYEEVIQANDSCLISFLFGESETGLQKTQCIIILCAFHAYTLIITQGSQALAPQCALSVCGQHLSGHL